MKNMKKSITTIVLVMTLAFILALTGCGTGGGNTGTAGTGSADTAGAADNGGDTKEDSNSVKVDVAGTAYSASNEDGDISFTVPEGWTVDDENEWADRGYVTVGKDANRRDDGYNQVYVEFHADFTTYTKEKFDEKIAGIEKLKKEYDETFEGCKEYKFNDNTFTGYRDKVTVKSDNVSDMRYLNLTDDGKLYEIRVYISDIANMQTDAAEEGINILLASFKPSV